MKHRPREGSGPSPRRGVGERSELIFRLFNCSSGQQCKLNNGSLLYFIIFGK
jgi:hypothetical protein